MLRTRYILLAIFVSASQAFGGVLGGIDNREPLLRNDPAIGFVASIMNGGSSCSVGLVGLRGGVTNKHCFFDETGSDISSWTPKSFVEIDPDRPNCGRFTRTDNTDVVAVVGLENMKPENLFEFNEVCWSDNFDIAVVSLDRNTDGKYPGEVYNTLQSCDIDTNQIRSANYAGFSEDFTFFSNHKGFGHIERACRVDFTSSNQNIRHFCDMDVGGSGGPIWVNFGNERCIMGVNSSHNCLPEHFNPQTERCSQAYRNNGVEVDSTTRAWLNRYEFGGASTGFSRGQGNVR